MKVKRKAPIHKRLLTEFRPSCAIDLVPEVALLKTVIERHADRAVESHVEAARAHVIFIAIALVFDARQRSQIARLVGNLDRGYRQYAAHADARRLRLLAVSRWPT